MLLFKLNRHFVLLSNCVALCSGCHRDYVWPRRHHHTHWPDWRRLVAGTWPRWNIWPLPCQLCRTSQLISRFQETVKGYVWVYNIVSLMFSNIYAYCLIGFICVDLYQCTLYLIWDFSMRNLCNINNVLTISSQSPLTKIDMILKYY